jgi:hypothetical protein
VVGDEHEHPAQEIVPQLDKGPLDHVNRSGRAFRVRLFRGLARVAKLGINL